MFGSNAGWAAYARLAKGIATMGRPLPMPSTSKPRGKGVADAGRPLVDGVGRVECDDEGVGWREHFRLARVLVVAAPGDPLKVQTPSP
jgi:hypothetical protein